MSQRVELQMRWAIRNDLPEILEVEWLSFSCPWTEEDFLECLRHRNCIGMVADWNERIAGFMIYELLLNQLHVLNFAVAPWARRQGVGAQMVETLINKLSQQRRQEITLEVRETNLDAQLFFRRMGLRSYGVWHGHYEDTDEDAYAMRYQMNPDLAVVEID